MILGCAKPSCLNFPSGASPHFTSFEKGYSDGFRLASKSSRNSINIFEKIECDEQFSATKCVKDGEWIGGIHPRSVGFDKPSFRCCRNNLMKKAKFQNVIDLTANEEFKNGGDIYEKGKLIGFDYISNIVTFENDDGIKYYEIFVNRFYCNSFANSIISTTALEVDWNDNNEADSSNHVQKQKLLQALIAEAENNVPNNVNDDLQNINEQPVENEAPAAGSAGGGASACSSCSNVQILTQTAAGPDVPITLSTATDANGCSVITVGCSSENSNFPLAFNWQGQGADRGTTIGIGTITETLTCNNAGQLILNEPLAPGVIEQVSCTSRFPQPPLNNFQAPQQFVQQPFQSVQIQPQQQPIAPVAPAQYPSAAATGFTGFPGFSAASLSYLCFSGDTTVETVKGKKIRMDELTVGEWILSGDSNGGELGHSKVNSWIHKKPNQVAEFLMFTLENGQTLKITKKHYIYKGNCQNVNNSASNSYEMAYAENVSIRDCLFSLNQRKQLIETRISRIELIKEKGIYAPLTENGNLIVNGIFASCYSFEAHINAFEK
uniref:Uncharacterized protein n=1 Tax=Panagrolaimus davidi TaxID=227884 RepID=A0A914RB27_9BILA